MTQERETELLTLATIEARVVRADDTLDPIVVSDLRADELADLENARFTLRALARKVGARYRALREQTMKEANP